MNIPDDGVFVLGVALIAFFSVYMVVLVCGVYDGGAMVMGSC